MHKPAESCQPFLNVHYTNTETPEATQARLKQYMHAGRGIYGVNPDMPLFEQSAVQSKMLFNPRCCLHCCIFAVMPIMSIYRLPLGQYEYAGHVINLPQDVVSFAQYLSAELDASLAPWYLRHPSYYTFITARL